MNRLVSIPPDDPHIPFNSFGYILGIPVDLVFSTSILFGQFDRLFFSFHLRFKESLHLFSGGINREPIKDNRLVVVESRNLIDEKKENGYRHRQHRYDHHLPTCPHHPPPLPSSKEKIIFRWIYRLKVNLCGTEILHLGQIMQINFLR